MIYYDVIGPTIAWISISWKNLQIHFRFFVAWLLSKNFSNFHHKLSAYSKWNILETLRYSHVFFFQFGDIYSSESDLFLVVHWNYIIRKFTQFSLIRTAFNKLKETLFENFSITIFMNVKITVEYSWKKYAIKNNLKIWYFEFFRIFLHSYAWNKYLYSSYIFSIL